MPDPLELAVISPTLVDKFGAKVVELRVGIETIRELRARHPGLKILAVSGGGRISTLGFLEIATELGATDSLSKPFDPQDLLAKVDALCGTGA